MKWSATLIAALVLTGAASAQDAEKAGEAGKDLPENAVGAKPGDRFVLVQTKDGWLRMDRTSGAVSHCKAAGAVFTCRLQPDERKAYEAEITRLESKISRLEERVTQFETGAIAVPEVPAEKKAAPEKEQAAKPRTEERTSRLPDLPSDEEIDEVMSFAEKVMRRFFDMVESFRRDPGPNET